jgi:hypothetical protein
MCVVDVSIVSSLWLIYLDFVWMLLDLVAPRSSKSHGYAVVRLETNRSRLWLICGSMEVNYTWLLQSLGWCRDAWMLDVGWTK